MAANSSSLLWKVAFRCPEFGGDDIHRHKPVEGGVVIFIIRFGGENCFDEIGKLGDLDSCQPFDKIFIFLGERNQAHTQDSAFIPIGDCKCIH